MQSGSMGAHDATSCSTAAAGSDGASDAHRPAPDDAPDQPLPGAFLLMLVPHLGGDLATLQALRASSRAARDAVDAATTDLRVGGCGPAITRAARACTARAQLVALVGVLVTLYCSMLHNNKVHTAALQLPICLTNAGQMHIVQNR